MSFFVFLTSRFICFSHRLQKRTCNSSTCFTQKLGEMLMNNVRGTPKTPMNVGPKSFGKRDIYHTETPKTEQNAFLLSQTCRWC
uniref:Calcitonin peptide-like domain-containing protein n=1 Tax=Poecilia latipinna TaxID=48699 RepID=A0A3B3UMW3_9TELE